MVWRRLIRNRCGWEHSNQSIAAKIEEIEMDGRKVIDKLFKMYDLSIDISTIPYFTSQGFYTICVVLLFCDRIKLLGSTTSMSGSVNGDPYLVAAEVAKTCSVATMNG